ncbi:MAG: S41 family peptidase [Cyanobium sp.]
MGKQTLKVLVSGIIAISILFPQQRLISQVIPHSERLVSVADEPTIKKVVESVLQRIEAEYVDSKFIRSNDWQAVRNRYLSRPYQSMEEAYAAIRAILIALRDPNTQFLDPQEFQDWAWGPSVDRVGIGLNIVINKDTRQLTVFVADNTPAQKAGICSKDILLKVDGQPTLGMELTKVQDLLLGKPGTAVVVTVQRGQQKVDIRVERAAITANPVRWNIQNSSRGKIGYIRLARFDINAIGQMRKAIILMEQQAVVGYILDLRGNSGGLYLAGLGITRLWLNDRLIVTLSDRANNAKREQSWQRALTQKPLVILVDEGSAAGSEILASALQENKRAKLVGSRTAGKNTIQSIKALPDGSGLALTVGKWITSKGLDISGKGLTPDVSASLTEKECNSTGTNGDLQYTKALELLNQLVQQSNTSRS